MKRMFRAFAVLALLAASALAEPSAVARAVDGYLAQAEPLRALASPGPLSFAAAADGDPDGWSFTVAPYAWVVFVDGTVGTPPLPAVVAAATVRFDIDDVWDVLDFVVFVYGEARKGRVGFFADLFYVDLSSDGTFVGPQFTTAKVDTSVLIAVFAVTHRIHDEQKATADLFAGGRFLAADLDFSLGAGTLPAQSLGDDKSWIDPLVGARGRLVLGKRFALRAMVNVGGFGVNSDFAWEIFVAVEYLPSESWSIVLGYRRLEIDFEDGSFVYDTAMQGLVLGAAFRF